MNAHGTVKLQLPQRYMEPNDLIDAPAAKPAKKEAPVFQSNFRGPHILSGLSG
jgi:hypothetical protein